MKEAIYHRVLTVAGSDSGGGAGIQADLKAFAANGCFGMSVITAVTAQNTLGVSGIHAVPVEVVAQQMEAVLSDIGADAVKIGMLFSAELIETVAGQLQKFGVKRVVLDPVMVATSGDRLLQDEAVAAMKERLIPMAELITPNLPEAAVLLGREISGRTEMEAAVRELAGLGCRNVLLTGGHRRGADSADCLYIVDTGRVVWLEGERVETQNDHGTGCTLSSAIAARMARGDGVEDAVRRGKEYITNAIRAGAGYRVGGGHGPVHHFWEFW